MSWLRTNRWWLPVLPISVALMLGGSSYLVHKLWWVQELRHAEATAAFDKPVTVTEDYSDAFGKTSRTFTVRLTGLTPQDRLAGFDGIDQGDPPPSGMEAIGAHLDWSAKPDQVLQSCGIALVDDHGRTYQPPSDSTQIYFCVPEDHEGPADPIGKATPRGTVLEGEERPESWQTVAVFAVPEGVHITQVRIWWSYPDYVALTAPSTTG